MGKSVPLSHTKKMSTFPAEGIRRCWGLTTRLPHHGIRYAIHKERRTAFYGNESVSGPGKAWQMSGWASYSWRQRTTRRIRNSVNQPPSRFVSACRAHNDKQKDDNSRGGATAAHVSEGKRQKRRTTNCKSPSRPDHAISRGRSYARVVSVREANGPSL